MKTTKAARRLTNARRVLLCAAVAALALMEFQLISNWGKAKAVAAASATSQAPLTCQHQGYNALVVALR
jgi:uncharacterized membrane protein YebE (DUF533 family)